MNLNLLTLALLVFSANAFGMDYEAYKSKITYNAIDQEKLQTIFSATVLSTFVKGKQNFCPEKHHQNNFGDIQALKGLYQLKSY